VDVAREMTYYRDWFFISYIKIYLRYKETTIMLLSGAAAVALAFGSTLSGAHNILFILIFNDK